MMVPEGEANAADVEHIITPPDKVSSFNPDKVSSFINPDKVSSTPLTKYHQPLTNDQFATISGFIQQYKIKESMKDIRYRFGIYAADN